MGRLVNTLWLFGIASLAAGACLAQQRAAVQAAAPGAARHIVVKPYVVWSGPYSQATKLGYHRVTSAREWAAVWSRHAGKQGEKDCARRLVVPKVDFTACMVVAVFGGRSGNCNGIDLVSITEFADRVRVRFDPDWFQTLGPDGGGVSVTPYGLFVIPRSSKALVLEEDVQDYIGAPPVWKERARLPALR